MLNAYRFDAQQCERVEDWVGGSKRLDSGQLLWIALRDPLGEEVAEVAERSNSTTTSCLFHASHRNARRLPMTGSTCK